MSEIERDELWMIFKVSENIYAINSKNVLSISALPDKITHVPDAPSYVNGIVRSRGRIITLIEVRELFGVKLLDVVYREFCSTIEVGKSGYKRWAEELKKCIQEENGISCMTSEHQNVLEKWYQRNEINHVSSGTVLSKVKVPHMKLHELAIKIESVKGEDAKEIRTQMLQEIENVLIPQIYSLLDQAKVLYKEHYKSMVISLEQKDGRAVGIIVDEIIGVEHLGDRCQDSTLEKMKHSKLLSGVALRETENTLMLLLDDAKVLALGKEVEVPAGI